MSTSINHLLRTQFKGLFIFLFFVFLATIHPYSGSGSNGNVEQWINLTNQSFYGNQDFLFSYGPLFWISGGVTAPYSVTAYWISVAFLSGVYAMFWASIISLTTDTRSMLFVSGIFLLFIGSLTFFPAQFLWPFILVIYLDRFAPKNLSPKAYLVLGFLIGIEFYIRFYWGMVAIATFGSYFASRALADKKIWGILLLAAACLASYLLLGLVIFHDHHSLLNYILINNQLSFGNSVDMTLDLPNRPGTWVAVAAIFVAFNVYAALSRKFLWITLNILLLLFLKVGFSRTDHYIEHFIPPVAVLSMLIALDKGVVNRIALLVVTVSLYFLSVVPSYPGAPVNKPFRPPVDFNAEYPARMQAAYADFRLSQDFLNIIGNGTIDVYPYNNEYVFANKLNYKHRPVFQNYMTLTPRLDLMNQAFFESDERPQFIIWSAGITCLAPQCNPFESFDGKYSLNEDPLTSSSILLNYHVVKTGAGRANLPLILLEKNPSIQKYSEVLLSSEKDLEFGKWYKVPPSKGGMLKLKPELKFSLYGRLKNMLFRGDILKVKYRLSSGEVKEYRTNILNAGNGIIASALPDNFDFSGPAATHIMLETSSRNYFAPSFDVQWVTIPGASVKAKPVLLDSRSDSAPRHAQEQTIDCEGAIDSVNNESYSDRTLSIAGNLNVRGWLASSTSQGELFDQTFAVITDKTGKQNYIATRVVERGDLVTVFKHDSLKSAGYAANIDISSDDGPSTLGLAGLKGSTLYRCRQFAAKFNFVQ